MSFYGDHFVRLYSQLPNGDQQKIEWVVLVNAFIKRDRKTPKKEIQKAIKLYKKYFHEKEKRDDP